VKKILLFCIFTYLLAYLLQLSLLNPQNIKSEEAKSILLLVMWVPAIVTIFIKKFSKEGFNDVGFRIGNLKYYLLAFLLILFTVPLEVFLSLLLGVAQYNDKFLTISQGAVQLGEDWKFALLFGFKNLSLPFFLLNNLVSMLVASIIGIIFAFGEELGWRGFLQNKLFSNMGITSGVIILGLIWGFWHLPVNLMGLQPTANPQLSAFVLFPLFTICFSVIFAWFYIKSKSIFLVSFLHSANNSINAPLIEKILVPKGNPLCRDLTSLAFWLIIAFFFFWLLRKEDRKGIS
jgi:membrane protease YdiL (CAAX protease family)